MTYSVAIRTLGKNPHILRRELESIARQTLRPDKVVIYIAEGYARPQFNVMGEIYVDTPKGMVAQRAVDYKEIDSELILLLDDDVELAENSAEKLISQLISAKADCMAADTFKNHEMSAISKIKAAIANLVFPNFSGRWAFKLHSNGSFSYINNPTLDYYPSQSAAGPASLWRKRALLSLKFEDELWLDNLGFAYGDDDLEFFKLYINGGRLYVSFNSGIENLDAKTASSAYHQDKKKFYVRAISNHIRWHRMQYLTRDKATYKLYAYFTYWLKQGWTFILHIVISLVFFNSKPITNYLKGLKDGLSYVQSEEYLKIPNYKNTHTLIQR